MYFRRSQIVKYFIAAFVGVAFYCEWFVYRMQTLYWQQLECQTHVTCTKVLFIADPQIQGDMAVPPPMNYLFNWDSDRYLMSTFSVVVNHFKPDILVFMGDLMDEGSISTMKQFHSYVKRLSDIFDVNYSVVQVWIPGDNDIGGENEPVKRDKVEEFEKVFEQPSVVTHRNISFYKVNAITHTSPMGTEVLHNDNLKIVISHYPLTHRYSFVKKVNDDIHPNIYFCAHDHESKYVKQKKDLTERQKQWPLYGDFVLHIPFADNWLYEISVPTCSYRMGTSKIGFGAAVLENSNEQMLYTVFWSPQRFPFIYFYGVFLILTVVYCLLFCKARLIYYLKSRKGTDKVPLLDKI